MPVLLDPEAVALRDAFTMLFWGSLLSGTGNRGPLVLIGAAAFVVVARALTRLRPAATDRIYRSRLGVAITAAYASAAFTALGVLAGRRLSLGPALVITVAPMLLGLVHTFAVIGAMSRLADIWEAGRLRLHWARAFRLTIVSAIAMTASVVAGFAAALRDPWLDRGSRASFFLLFFVGILIGLAALVQYLVAIWQMRSAAERAARVPVPA